MASKKRKSGVSVRTHDLNRNQLMQRHAFNTGLMSKVKKTQSELREDSLNALGRKALKENAYPEIRNKRVGCKYEGWLRISLANRSPEWRLERMQFYGDWCTDDMLDEILPEYIDYDDIRRRFTVDLYLIDVLGNEYQVEPLVVINPKNLMDLETKIRQYCWDVVSNQSFLFNLDECYADIRA